MSVDMQMLASIHRLETELKESGATLKELSDERHDIIAELPEYRSLLEAQAALKDAQRDFKAAIQRDGEVNRITEAMAETRFLLRDVRQMLSHHLVAYKEETGRDVVRDHEGRIREIEFKAKEGKPTLDQDRLPLGLNKHFGQKQPIGTTPPIKHLESPKARPVSAVQSQAFQEAA